MKTIFVTGASGMIGMEICHSLLSKGFKVFATDKSSNEFVGRENYSFIQSSITDKTKITGIIDSNKFDAMIHLANSVDNDIPTYVADQEMDDSKATDKFLWKAVASAGIHDVLLLSTTQVYAPSKSREPIRETHDAKPQTNYGKMKADSEEAMFSALKKSSCISVIMRIAPVYKASFTQNLRDKVYDNKDDVGFVYREGEYGFSFCCMYNLTEFINAIMVGPQGHYDGAFNVCDTRMTLAREILEYERAFHRIGAVLQRTEGAEVLKAAMALAGSKRAKCDYRFVDLATITSNMSYDNTKAQRISTFRWKLANTK